MPSEMRSLSATYQCEVVSCECDTHTYQWSLGTSPSLPDRNKLRCRCSSIIPGCLYWALLAINFVSIFPGLYYVIQPEFHPDILSDTPGAANASRELNSRQFKLETVNQLLETVGRSVQSPAAVPTVNFDHYMERELSRRRETLKKACTQLNATLPPADSNYSRLYRRVLVNHKHKLLFSFIPKVSCTMWKDLVREEVLGKVDPILIPWYLKRYKKAVFVREPITRLLSAWMSKFSGITRPDLQEIWEKAYGNRFLSLVRNDQTTKVSKDSKKHRWLNITFEELARFVVALGPNYNMSFFSDHWLPQSRVAHACHIQYDFIGRFENLATEGPYLFKWLGAENGTKFPLPQASAASGAFMNYTRRLSVALLRDLFHLYKDDYEMFGYSTKETMEKIEMGLSPRAGS